MAELASSIITIATVSLAIIKETVNYIKEIRLVDRVVNRLLTNLKDLHELIRLVELTYQRANSDKSEPSVFVKQNLIKCRDRIRDVKPMIFELASRNTDTFFKKVSLKRKSDAVKEDIETIIHDIRLYMEDIRVGISCWSL